MSIPAWTTANQTIKQHKNEQVWKSNFNYINEYM